MLMMYIHTHLYKKEIIGLIGGRIKNKGNISFYNSLVIEVVKVFPCKTEHTEDEDHNVEMDPVSQ